MQSYDQTPTTEGGFGQTGPKGPGRQSARPLSNERCIAEIVSRLEREAFFRDELGLLTEPANVEISKLDIDYWSFIFQVNWRDGNQDRGVFIKIPRSASHDDRIAVTPRNGRAVHMAKAEFASLSRLYEFSQKQPPGGAVASIRPLAFWPEWNAIVTARVFGSDLFLALRRNLLPLMGAAPGENHLGLLLSHLGEWLFDFQYSFTESSARLLRTEDYAVEIDSYWRRILSDCSAMLPGQALARRLAGIRLQGELSMCANLEGFEVRNILLERETNRMYVLDPGEISITCYLENVAQFLASLDILYWGTPWFLLGRRPAPAVRNEFLRGFSLRSPLPPAWLRFFYVKQLLRLWNDACCVLKRKSLPLGVSAFLQRVYIDQFYMRELETEISGLEARSEY
jgi:hypothetical protein